MHVGETKSIVSSNLTNPTFSLHAFFRIVCAEGIPLYFPAVMLPAGPERSWPFRQGYIIPGETDQPDNP